MKIIAINGSHRGTMGYTHFLIEKLFEGAKKEGAECEEITLAKLLFFHNPYINSSSDFSGCIKGASIAFSFILLIKSSVIGG